MTDVRLIKAKEELEAKGYDTDGGTTDCVYLAVTSMWTYEEAPDQGY